MKQYSTLLKAAFFAFLFSSGAVYAQNVGIDQTSPAEKLDVNGAVRVGNTSGNNAGSIRYIVGTQKFQINIAGTWYDIATGNLAYINDFSYNATTNELSITEGSTVHTVDLDDLQDNTDDQDITLSGNTLSIEDGNSVDLSGYLDNTDNQTISYNTLTNILTLQNGGTVDLTELQDNTDDQSISYNATTNVVTLEDGGTINLSDLQDNTDDQVLTLTGNSLAIESGNSVDLSGYLDDTDDQTLNLSGNTLSIQDGNNVSLAGFMDNTDDQNLTLSGSSLSIEDGNSVSLATLLDNTDDQAISYNATTNVVTLEDGGTINLSDLQDNTDDQAISYSPGTNVVTLENGGTIDLSDLEDNTDNQTITYNSTNNIITLQNGGTVDLSDLQDNTDDQTISLSGNTLSIESGNSVSLAGYTNTDDQAISYNATTNVVTLESGGTINLSDLQDNTDDQTISYNAGTNVITLESGGTVNLSDLQDNTDDQAISYNAGTNVITLEDGGSVNLSDLQDNTDDQTLAEVYAEGGNTVQMSAGGGDVRFYKSGAEMLFLDQSSGNVGIGTTNPASRLDMASGSILFNTADYNGMYFGNLYLDGSAHNGAWAYVRQTATNGQLEIGSDQVVDFYETDGRALRVRMDLNSGNVGIGSSGPLQKLDVAGEVNSSVGYRIANTATSGTFLRGNGTRYVASTIQAGDIPAGSGNYIRNQTGQQGSSNFYISGTGRGSVFNANTKYQLNGKDVIYGSSTDVYANIRVIQNNSSSTQDGMYINYNSTGTSNADLRFYANGTNERMRIDASNGRVGINTTAPAELLHVNGNVRGNQSGALRISTGSGYVDVGPKNTSWSHFYTDRGRYYFNVGITVDQGLVGSYNEDLYLQTSGTTRMQISNSNGDVSLNGKHAFRSNDSYLRLNQNGAFSSGTYTPGAFRADGHLHVYNTSANLYLRDSDSRSYILHCNSDRLYILRSSSNGGTSWDSNRPFTIYQGNKVGINVTTPSYQLHVSGRIKSNGINETSDERLKKDIKDIENPLEKVMEMRGVTYNWKVDEFPKKFLEEGMQYGLIAQELEKILPELVDTDDEGWKSVEYTHLVPILLEAIKEQQNIIDEQGSAIDALKAERKADKSTTTDLAGRVAILEALILEQQAGSTK